jgi:hypothetical protein
MNNLSKHGKLNKFDLLKTMIIVIGTSIMGSLIPVITTGHFPEKEQISLIIGTAVGAGFTYLLKQVRTDSNGTIY